MLNDLKQFMFYDRPPQLNIPVEHRENVAPLCLAPICVAPISVAPLCLAPISVAPICVAPDSEIKPQKPHPPQKPQPQEKQTKKQVFTPHQKDTLFWCFYKIIHDELPDNINIAMEKTLKIQYVEKMRKHKELIKKHKFASISHIENQLANEIVIDITAFFVLSLIHKLNVVYVKNKTYFELIENEDSELPIYIIYFLEQSKYGYSTTRDKTTYNIFYKIDNLNKPIKAISSYKVSELIEICNKLSIETDELKNKKHYYEAIIKKID